MMVPTPVNLTPEQSGDDRGHYDDANDDDVMDIDNPERTLASIKKIDTKSHAAQFILKTRDGGHLTQANANRIVQDAKMMVQSTIDSLKVQLIERVKEHTNLSDETVKEITQVFQKESLNPFDGMETLHLQEKYFKEHFNYVVSHI